MLNGTGAAGRRSAGPKAAIWRRLPCDAVRLRGLVARGVSRLCRGRGREVAPAATVQRRAEGDRRFPMARFRLVLGAVLASVLAAGAALACSCADPGPPCRALPQADAVFVGTVEAVDERGEAGTPGAVRQVRLLVDENFRGAGVKRGASLEVVTGFGGGDCGYGFERGERYLVYAQHRSGGGSLYAGICSRTARLADAADDLAYLRARDRAERTAGIEGRIDELRRDPGTSNTYMVGPMRGVTVIAERDGDGQRAEAKTDGQGWFRIWGLTFGQYRVRAVLPDGFVPEATTRDHVSVESGVCGWVHMLATPRP